MKNFINFRWTFPLLLLLVSLACYGILINQMFFYWDDLPTIWYFQSGGGEIFQKVFSEDRPFLATLFILTMPVIKTSVLGWQVFAIVTRWLVGIVFWFLLNLLWENRKLENALFSLLFVIYPGFLEQWIAVTYSHAFIIYTVFLLSFVFMVLSLKEKNKKKFLSYSIFAVITQLFVAFCTEYFLGLELLRFFIIAIVVNRYCEEKPWGKEYFSKVVKYWSVYLFSLGFFVFWRLFIHPFPRNAIQTVNDSKELLPFVLSNLGTLSRNALESGILVWGQPFNLINYINFDTDWLTIIILFMTVGFIVYYGLVKVFQDVLVIQDTIERDFWKFKTLLQQWEIQVGLIAVISIVAGLIPFRLVNLVVRPTFPYDRFTLSQMFGSSLLIGLLLIILVRQPRKMIVASAILTGIVCIFHYATALKYVKEGEIMKDFLWQFSIRAPSIDDNTTLMTSQWSFQFNTDNSITAPLNWMYGNYPKEAMPLLAMDVQARLGKSLPGKISDENGRIEIEKNASIKESYRAFEFTGNTFQALVFYYNPPACLRLMDPKLDFYLSYPETMYDLIPFSNLSLVNTKTSIDPIFLRLIGKRSKKDWCVYYQEAALSSQKGEWEQIIKLGQLAFNEHHLQPKDAAELFPFIEGYAHTGNWQRAKELSLQAYNMTRTVRSGLCVLWKKIKQSDVAPKKKIYSEVRQLFMCENG